MSKKTKGVDLKESAEALAKLTQQMSLVLKAAKAQEQTKTPVTGKSPQGQKKAVTHLSR